MLTKRVIPCFDVDKGRVVKGVSFVELRDAGDPVELAPFYDAEGADELVFLDITASSDDRRTTYDMVERTAAKVFIPFTVGGGVRSEADVRLLLELGADKVSLNSAAVADPLLVGRAAERFGSQCIVVAIDAHLDGYDTPLTQAIAEAVEVPLIASGGCGTPQHMVEAVVAGKADAVLAASIFHYGTYRIRECKDYMV